MRELTMNELGMRELTVHETERVSGGHLSVFGTGLIIAGALFAIAAVVVGLIAAAPVALIAGTAAIVGIGLGALGAMYNDYLDVPQQNQQQSTPHGVITIETLEASDSLPSGSPNAAVSMPDMYDTDSLSDAESYAENYMPTIAAVDYYDFGGYSG